MPDDQLETRSNFRDFPRRVVIHCPKCGTKHVDKLEADGRDWRAIPHHKHLCSNTDCGHIWEPYPGEDTVGVESLSATPTPVPDVPALLCAVPAGKVLGVPLMVSPALPPDTALVLPDRKPGETAEQHLARGVLLTNIGAPEREPRQDTRTLQVFKARPPPPPGYGFTLQLPEGVKLEVEPHTIIEGTLEFKGTIPVEELETPGLDAKRLWRTMTCRRRDDPDATCICGGPHD